MFKVDLSKDESERLRPGVEVRNIGWLASPEPFARGEVEPSLVRKLEELAVCCPVLQMRGFHYCEFCEEEELVVTAHNKRRLLGSAELWIPSTFGIVYAAPDMISHYIRRHSYSPPQEFLSALKEFDVGTATSAELEERWLLPAS